MEVIEINDFSQLIRYQPSKSFTHISAEKWNTDFPELHLLVVESDELKARCSLWWKNTPELEGQRLGFVGHYFASDSQASELLFTACFEKLALQGCGLCIGPIDGSTWKPYRLVSETNDFPPFFLELETPLCWNEYFRNAGFQMLRSYCSVMNQQLDWEDAKTDQVAKQRLNEGFVLRNFNRDESAIDFQKIHQLSLQSFQGNFLYSPITEQEFFNLYDKVLSHIEPEFVLLLELNDELIAYLFAIPNLAQAIRGDVIDEVIIKTLAVHPQYTNQRIGNWLSKTLYQKAKELGFKKVIHALMIDDNQSSKMHSSEATVVRRYSLYAKRLGRY